MTEKKFIFTGPPFFGSGKSGAMVHPWHVLKKIADSLNCATPHSGFGPDADFTEIDGVETRGPLGDKFCEFTLERIPGVRKSLAVWGKLRSDNRMLPLAYIKRSSYITDLEMLELEKRLNVR
jgi:hypothetical protein